MSSFRPGTLAWLLLLMSAVLKIEGQIDINNHPEDIEAFVGQTTVALDCSFTLSTGLVFDHWLHNGNPVSVGLNNTDYDISTSSRTSILEIKTFRPELAGEYRCQFSKDEGTHTDVVLTLPAVVRYFGQSDFSSHPMDFESYVLEKNDSMVDYSLGRKPREVIAFECTYTFHPHTTLPAISWQTCNSDGSFTDLPEATEFLQTPRDRIKAYVFFQSNFTSYLQISNSTDPVYNGSRYRCKAASQVAGDSAEAFSSCASVIQYDESVAVPDTSVLPVFRTIPQRDIYVTETVDGAMACTVQNQPDLNNLRPIVVQNSGNESVILNYHSTEPGLENVGENNLRVDYFTLFDDGVEEATFTCRLDSTEEVQQSTFHILREPELDQPQQSLIVPVHEDSPVNFSLALAGNPGGDSFQAFKNGVPLSTDDSRYTYSIQPPNVHLLQFASAQESDRGVWQLEVANPASTVAVYHHLRVSLKARALTPDQIIQTKVTQRLILLCQAAENGDGPYINFKWQLGSSIRLFLGINPASNRAITSYSVSSDLLLEDAGVYSCTPSNIVGSKGSTYYTVTVTKFDAPANVTASVNETSMEVTITWSPIEVNQTLYPGANVEEYIVELFTVTPTGFVKVGELNVSSNSSEAVFSVNSVQNYHARVKGRTNGRDVTNVTPLPPLPPPPSPEPTPEPTPEPEPTPSPEPSSTTLPSSLRPRAADDGFPGWAVFLILLFIFIVILLLILLLCICCFCLAKREPKGEYDAEKREEKYYEAERKTMI